MAGSLTDGAPFGDVPVRGGVRKGRDKRLATAAALLPADVGCEVILRKRKVVFRLK